MTLKGSQTSTWARIPLWSCRDSLRQTYSPGSEPGVLIFWVFCSTSLLTMHLQFITVYVRMVLTVRNTPAVRNTLTVYNTLLDYNASKWGG